MARLIAFLAVGALAALGASPASAFLVRLKNGKELSYEALAGARAPRSASRFDAVFSNLDYSGGPVMPSNVNNTIVWNPSNYTGTPFQSGYTAGVSTFLSDVAADSGSAGNSYSVASQYNDANGNTAAYQSTNAGTLTDNDPLPNSGCASGGNPCLTDAQIQAELDSFLSANNLPRDLTHEYFLLTPPDVVSCFDPAGAVCSGQATAPATPVFCAYHSASSTPSSFLYVNAPDLVGLNGCDPFATDAFGSPCSSASPCPYPNSPADGVLSAISHEQIESMTDPQPNNAWTDWQFCGSSPAPCGGEIGDKCNNDAYQDPNTTFTGAGAPFNETINGDRYWIQMEWSNQTRQCLDSFTSNGTAVTASYSSSQGPPDTINFDATASTGGVAQYVWQFNDGPGQQTTTVETTSPTISHTFPAPGNYTVALTAMAGDGTSSGTARTVLVGPLLNPTAAFSVNPPSALEGTTFSFDGSSSSDPNAGASISYSWDFADGSPAGAGATTTHVFTAGIYTVTLTVTDNFGRSNSTQRTLTVTDEMPSASFNPPSGVAGTPVAFSGSGSDADGTITAYNWTFGDGAAGSGASPSHTYSAGGTYNVVLTVTDSSGQAASVSHLVSIASPPPPPPAPTNCTVPNVIGKSLAAAGKAIKAAHCAVGKVSGPGKKPKRSPGRHKTWAVIVSRQNPGPRGKRSRGTKVKLTLVWQAVKR